MKIINVESATREGKVFVKDWHFTIEGQKEEIIISEDIIDEIIEDYLRRHTNNFF